MDFSPLQSALRGTAPDVAQLRRTLAGRGRAMLAGGGHGDRQRLLQVLAGLPHTDTRAVHLDRETVTIETARNAGDQLAEPLRALGPWRKGPFSIDGLHIDSEWRSDMKWARLAPHVHWCGKSVLDVGSGNGYYALRALGAGAACVVGVDPGATNVAQFEAIKHFIDPVPAWVLPLRDTDLPPDLGCFDVALSMGVLYHHGSPFPHLRTLRNALRPGGQLVLETLVTEGDAHHAFVPEDRYAGMRNVYFLPSPAALSRWLTRVGFSAVRCVDVTRTSTAEQRSTAFSPGQSLIDFLDPSDPSRTREGHPAPTRAILLASRP